jgi:hypothetical protein
LRYGRRASPHEAFLASPGSAALGRHVAFPFLTPKLDPGRDLPLPGRRRARTEPLQRSARPTPLGPPLVQRPRTGAGILTSCPSPTPRGLGLGPTNPTRINLPSEPSGFRRERFSRSLTLLMPAFSLHAPPPALAGSGFAGDADAPLPLCHLINDRVRSFGA